MVSIYTNTTSDNNVFFEGKPRVIRKNITSKPLLTFQKVQDSFDNIVPKFYIMEGNYINMKNYVHDYANEPIHIDGKIGDTKQVKNDCWLLAGINALANTSRGKEYIKKSIVHNNGDYVAIHFAGTNTTISVPKMVLAIARESNKYVKGDDDMLAIELATEYYKKQLIANNDTVPKADPNVVTGKHSLGNYNDPLAGGYSSDIMFLLTGKRAKTIFNDKAGSLKSVKDLVAKKQKSPDKYAITCNFKKPKYGLIINHAYVVKNVDNKFVTLINPHNTKQEKKVPIEQFYENVKSLTMLNL